VTIALQQIDEPLAQARFVFHDQDTHTLSVPSRLPRRVRRL
jgi:hypothetical protein